MQIVGTSCCKNGQLKSTGTHLCKRDAKGGIKSSLAAAITLPSKAWLAQKKSLAILIFLFNHFFEFLFSQEVLVSLFLAFNMFFDYPRLFENPTCSTAFCFLEDHVQQHYFNVVVEKCKFILILHMHILKVMRMILVSLSSAYFNLFFFPPIFKHIFICICWWF